MSTANILEIAKGHLTNSNIEKLSGTLNEEPSGIKLALTAILPSVLGAIMQNASTTRGAGEVHDLVRKYEDNDLVDRLPAILGSQREAQDVFTKGKQLLPGLFGGKISQLSEKVSEDTGISQSSATSLFGFASSLLFSIIGSQVNSSGYGLSGVTTLLMQQKDAVILALPVAFSRILNFDDLGDFKGSRERQTDEIQSKKSSAWPVWLIVVLAIIGLIWILKTCKKEESSAVKNTGIMLDSAEESVKELADSTAGKIKGGLETLGKFFSRKLPNGIQLNIPEFGIENKLATFIENKDVEVDKTTWFNFDRITFEVGSNRLSPESLEQTKNIAEILKAFPSASLKIGGYTDNTGSADLNKRLSQERADAVKLAIVSEGIESIRLEAEGYGQEHPVASNDTEEGRAQNRRIAVRVTRK
jgi:OOP family OmpA-OmpF porin